MFNSPQIYHYFPIKQAFPPRPTKLSSDTVVEPVETTEPPLAGGAGQSFPSETEYVLKKPHFCGQAAPAIQVGTFSAIYVPTWKGYRPLRLLQR